MYWHVNEEFGKEDLANLHQTLHEPKGGPLNLLQENEDWHWVFIKVNWATKQNKICVWQ
jgi:hypothetical protein